jgi:hypothetical protein
VITPAQDARSDVTESDAWALENAADVLEARAQRRTFLLAVFCSVLRKRAARIRAGKA